MKTFTLAILADTCTPSVLRYAHIPADTYPDAVELAGRIGAVVCGWRWA